MNLYSAMAVANFIVNKCYVDKKPVSNLQLQKILYFTWVDYYKQTEHTLFWDNICAWPFGPVVPEVYYEYCAYGGRPINIRCESEISPEDEVVLNNIINQYVDVPVNVLVNRTHEKGTAWDTIYQDGVGNRQVIPFELIKQKECGGTYVS